MAYAGAAWQSDHAGRLVRMTKEEEVDPSEYQAYRDAYHHLGCFLFLGRSTGIREVLTPGERAVGCLKRRFASRRGNTQPPVARWAAQPFGRL